MVNPQPRLEPHKARFAEAIGWSSLQYKRFSKILNGFLVAKAVGNFEGYHQTALLKYIKNLKLEHIWTDKTLVLIKNKEQFVWPEELF